MIQRAHDPAASPLRAPAPTFVQTLPRGLQRAAVTAVLVSLAYVALVLLFNLLAGRASLVAASGFMVELGVRAVRLAGVVFVATFLISAVFMQRAWQDRAFTVVGLGATFFGLGMLLFFFTQLALDVRTYFAVMPVLIEQRNLVLKEQVQQAEEMIQSELAKVRRQMEVDLAAEATDAEKQAVRELYESDILPNKLKDLRITAGDKIVIAEHGVREDTSSGALFWHFLTRGSSDKPQDVGILPALLGSIWVALITILFAVPVGVGAAVYLEEYRNNSWLGSIIQVNINNLAGVPSVVYGILGAFVFVELIFKPLTHWYPDIAARNVLGGGLTLGLLTLPVIIVSAQEAIRAVPVSIRQGAYALGATRWQVTWHQVLPMSLPGIFTGTILALSRAIGEAAPLILFGAMQFVDQEPSLFSPFTILPMQIFNWSERPPLTVPGFAQPVEVGHAIAALASVLLLAVLLSLNGVAIYLRNRAQRRTRA
jgi:phosphate transport system permease protein